MRQLDRWAVALLLLALTTLVTVPTWSEEAAPYRVIVHRDNPATSISKSQLSDFLLKKRTKWVHGVAADPVDLDSGSDVRKAFSRDVHGRSVSSIKNYWQKQDSPGQPEPPPPEMASDAEVISYVISHPGAIGYVSSQARLDSVKTLSVADG